METMLKGVCDKANFMDLLKNFILFEDSVGEPKEILTRTSKIHHLILRTSHFATTSSVSKK